MIRAIIYLRQSLDPTGEGLAVERQRVACVELCRSRGWTVVDTITDNDTSATSGTRKGFNDLLRRAGEGRVDVIVVWAVDRLVRQLGQLEEVIDVCEAHGVKLATVSGDLDLSTDQGRLVGRILASVARGEVERKATRQKAANRKRAEDGEPHAGGNKAFGYTPDGDALVDVEADAVRDAYSTILGGGSLRSVARYWDSAGLVSGQGRWGTADAKRTGWSTASVRWVLTNPRNAGIRVYDGIEYPGTWPAIVTEETYRAAVALLTDPDRRTAGAHGVALLTSVAVCGTCGATVQSGGGGWRPAKEGAERNRYRVYRCSVGSGAHVMRRAEQIDSLVVSLVLGRLQRPDAADLIARQPEIDVPALIIERETIRKRAAQLAEEFAADDALTVTALRAATDRFNRRLADIGDQLAAAGQVSALVPLVTADDAAAAWEALDIDRQRAAVRELMTVRILSVGRGVRTFRPESVEITWKV